MRHERGKGQGPLVKSRKATTYLLDSKPLALRLRTCTEVHLRVHTPPHRASSHHHSTHHHTTHPCHPRPSVCTRCGGSPSTAATTLATCSRCSPARRCPRRRPSSSTCSRWVCGWGEVCLYDGERERERDVCGLLKVGPGGSGCLYLCVCVLGGGRMSLVGLGPGVWWVGGVEGEWMMQEFGGDRGREPLQNRIWAAAHAKPGALIDGCARASGLLPPTLRCTALRCAADLLPDGVRYQVPHEVLRQPARGAEQAGGDARCGAHRAAAPGEAPLGLRGRARAEWGRAGRIAGKRRGARLSLKLTQLSGWPPCGAALCLHSRRSGDAAAPGWPSLCPKQPLNNLALACPPTGMSPFTTPALQAGSDSLLTSATFLKLAADFFNG